MTAKPKSEAVQTLLVAAAEADIDLRTIVLGTDEFCQLVDELHGFGGAYRLPDKVYATKTVPLHIAGPRGTVEVRSTEHRTEWDGQRAHIEAEQERIASRLAAAEGMLKPGISHVRLAAFGVEVELHGVPRAPAPVAPKLDTLEERERRRVLEEREAERARDLVLYGAAATDDEAP